MSSRRLGALSSSHLGALSTSRFGALSKEPCPRSQFDAGSHS
ncbi:hypothetical protein [Nocardia noduli]|nr:hypothetical protein [Nocardia noduli]